MSNHSTMPSSSIRSFIRLWFAPFEDFAALARECGCGEDAQPPGLESEGSKRVTGRAGPYGNNSRVVTNRRRSVQELVPDRRAALVVEHPGRAAFGETCVVRRRPVVEGNIWTCFEVGALHRRWTRTDPTNQLIPVPLPERVKNARARTPARIDSGSSAPHDPVRHLDKGRRYF
jgi:hypothetical protein